MFCKWCGNDLRLTDQACPTCGRKTPPASDCGGLYDLRRVNPGPVVVPPVNPGQISGTGVPQRLEGISQPPIKGSKGTMRICVVVIMLAVCLVTALCLYLCNRIANLEAQIERLRTEISAEGDGELSETEKPDESDPEPTETSAEGDGEPSETEKPDGSDPEPTEISSKGDGEPSETEEPGGSDPEPTEISSKGDGELSETEEPDESTPEQTEISAESTPGEQPEAAEEE